MTVFCSACGASFTDAARFCQKCLLRAVYFVLIGIWLSAVWMAAAWIAAALIITLPLAFWMFDRVPAVTTLRVT